MRCFFVLTEIMLFQACPHLLNFSFTIILILSYTSKINSFKTICFAQPNAFKKNIFNCYYCFDIIIIITLINFIQFSLFCDFQGFSDKDVFVCESRYNGKTRTFKKLKVIKNKTVIFPQKK